MTRFFLLGLAALFAGCTVTVSSDEDKSTTLDGATGDDDDDVTGDDDDDVTGDDDDDVTGDDDDDTTDTDTTDTDPDPVSCDGSYVGTYSGYESGTFDAVIDTVTMTMAVADVEQSGFLDGVVDIEADGSLYGDSQGVWMDGTLDWDTCTASGDWGVVEAPGVPLGTWEI